MELERIPFSQFSTFSRLFATYAGAFDEVAGYFAGDFRDPRQRGQIAKQVSDQFGRRELLCEVLSEQNSGWGVGQSTMNNIDRLSHPDAVAVVTGQQLGLFTGPLYTLYKTITAVQLAKKLENESGRPVVPVFWLEGEDHDFAEVTSVGVQNPAGFSRITYMPSFPEQHPIPVGKIAFSDAIAQSVDEFEEALAPTEFRKAIVQAVRDTYQPGTSFMQAFIQLMNRMVGGEGVVFASGDDPRLKKLAVPLFKKELAEFAKSSNLLAGTSRKLEESYHAQVKTTPTNLFLITDEGRRSLVVNGAHYNLKGSEATYTRDELMSLLQTEPEAFSPNVVLRPIMQDTILPTAAYIAGPGEVAYFAQYKGIYEWAGVPMPIIYPRASVTLVERNVRKILDRYALTVPDLEKDLDQLFHSIVVDAMDIDADGIFERAGQHIHDAIHSVVPAIEAVDPSLRKSAESTRVSLLKEWSRLKDRVVKAEKRRHDQTRSQLSKTRSNLFPDGIPQERCISPLYFMNKYGEELVERLLQEISLDTTSHQVAHL